ncbi:MAG: hypothetical protein ACOC0N_06315 [Chroococcales cyanobacterium]
MNIEELTTQILSSRSISRLEQQFISVILSQEELNEQERTLIERIFYGLRHGILQVKD